MIVFEELTDVVLYSTYLTIFIFNHLQAATKEERKKMLETFAKNCQAQEKATDSDYDDVMKHELPTTETGNCMRACVFEAFGMVCLNNDSHEN